jgi:hypothetical protein
LISPNLDENQSIVRALPNVVIAGTWTFAPRSGSSSLQGGNVTAPTRSAGTLLATCSRAQSPPARASGRAIMQQISNGKVSGESDCAPPRLACCYEGRIPDCRLAFRLMLTTVWRDCLFGSLLHMRGSVRMDRAAEAGRCIRGRGGRRSQRSSLGAATPAAKRPVYAGFDRSLLPTYVISVAWSRSKSAN